MSSEEISSDVNQNIAEAAPVQEQMLPQSKVNELVANAKLVSAEKARKEAEAKYAQMMQSQGGSMGMSGQQVQPQQEMPDFGALVEQKLAEKEQAILHNQQREWIKSQADKFNEGMSQGENLYSDFKEVTGNYNPSKFGHVTLLAAQVDNVADVMYDLLSNPMKLTNMQKLAEIDDNLALEEMRKLSASIKRNEQAVSSNQKSPSPLSKLKTSIAGADSGKKTIADYKRMFKA